MHRRGALIGMLGALVAAGCTPLDPASGRTQGQRAVVRYREGDEPAVQFRMLDSINAFRSAQNVPPLTLNAALNAAAKTHAIDMAAQNRPWHFGSDGSSPLDRVTRAGYPGTLAGEAISETFESELETVTAWMADPLTRSVILDRNAGEMGIAYFQEADGKLWWTLVTGYPPGVAAAAPAAVPPPL